MHSKNRVVITGVGLITPVGKNKDESWNSIINGRSGLSCFKTPYNLGYPSPVIGSVGDVSEKLNSILSVHEQRKTARFIQLALIAAYEAFYDSGLDETFPVKSRRSAHCSFFVYCSTSAKVLPMTAGFSATAIPHDFNVEIFSAAVPFPPEIIAPA